MASLLAWLCGARAPTGYMPTASKDLENALSDALRTSCGFNGESYGRALTAEERRKLYTFALSAFGKHNYLCIYPVPPCRAHGR